jgi:hypothetical protein
MKQLMQKDVLIKAAFMAYMYGRFTYTQVMQSAACGQLLLLMMLLSMRAYAVTIWGGTYTQMV